LREARLQGVLEPFKLRLAAYINRAKPTSDLKRYVSDHMRDFLAVLRSNNLSLDDALRILNFRVMRNGVAPEGFRDRPMA